MPVKIGRDSAGHRYKSIDGKRVPIGDKGKASQSNPDPINKLQEMWKSDSGAAKQAVAHAIKSKFQQALKISTITSVGRYGRMKAAQALMAMLKGSPSVHKVLDDEGNVDLEKVNQLLKAHGVPATVGESEDTSAEKGNEEEDALILKVVHHYGLTAKELAVILAHEDTAD